MAGEGAEAGRSGWPPDPLDAADYFPGRWAASPSLERKVLRVPISAPGRIASIDLVGASGNRSVE